MTEDEKNEVQTAVKKDVGVDSPALLITLRRQ